MAAALIYFIFLKNIKLTEWLLGKHRREPSRYSFESCLPLSYPHITQVTLLLYRYQEKMRKKIADALLRPNWCYAKHASHQISITLNTAQCKVILTMWTGLNPISLQIHMNSLLYTDPGTAIHFDKMLLSSIKTAWAFCLPMLGLPTAAIETNGRIYFHGWRAKLLETFVFKEKHFSSHSWVQFSWKPNGTV